MSEMIERAARAVAITSDAETAARATIGQEPYVQEAHRAIARAVIEAMREPTTEMILSCAEMPCSQQEMWRRSIAAALND